MHTNTNYQGPPQPWPPGQENNEMHDPPWDIECVKTRGINIQKNMLGDLINFQDVITQTFEIFFVNPLTSKDLAKWISMINNYEDLGTWQNEINLYGIKIQNCRITSESAPTSVNSNESAVGRGSINLEIEQRVCGDTENIQGVTHYDGLDTLFSDPDVCPYLDGISEEFTFNYGKGQQVDITHSITITPFDSCPTGLLECYECHWASPPAGVPSVFNYVRADNIDAALSTCVSLAGGQDVAAVLAANQWLCAGGPAEPGEKVPSDPATGLPELCRPGQYDINKALDLAKDILDNNLPAFGLKYQPGQYKDIQNTDDVICYYSETQNLITGECSMSKKITLLTEKDANLDWTADYKHSLTMTSEGILNVTETGTVKGNKKCDGDFASNVSDKAFKRSIEGMDEWLKGDPPAIAGDPYGAAAIRCAEFYTEHLCHFTGPWNDCCLPTTTPAPATTPPPVVTTTAPPTTTPRPALREETWSTHVTTTTAAPAPCCTATGVWQANFDSWTSGIIVDNGGKCWKLTGDALEYNTGTDPTTGDRYYETAPGSGQDQNTGLPFWEECECCVVTTTLAPCTDCPALSTAFPTDLSKNINGVGRDVSYSITFTDDPEMAQGYFASRTIKADKDSNGIITISETSNLTQFQDKGSDASAPGPGTYPINPQAPDGKVDNPWAIIYPLDKGGQAQRVKDFYDSLQDFNIRDDGCLATVIKDAKLKSTSVNYNPNGRTLNYTTEWTGDKGISCEYPDEFGIRKIDISTEDKLPQRIREEYPIIQWKMMVHDSGQTDIGERSVNVKAFLDRVPKENRLTDPKLPRIALEHMVDPLTKDELVEVFKDNSVDNLIEDDMYIKLCQWGWDSKGSANFSAAINYLQKR